MAQNVNDDLGVLKCTKVKKKRFVGMMDDFCHKTLRETTTWESDGQHKTLGRIFVDNCAFRTNSVSEIYIKKITKRTEKQTIQMHLFEI